MKVKELAQPNVRLIVPTYSDDNWGHGTETYNDRPLREYGVGIQFVVDYECYNQQTGTIWKSVSIGASLILSFLRRAARTSYLGRIILLLPGKLAAELMGKKLARNRGMGYTTARIVNPYGERNLALPFPNVVIDQLCSGIRPKLIEGKEPYDQV